MAGELLASKIVIVEEAPRIRSVPALPTAVVGAVGVTQRGPIGVPTLVTSFEEYFEIFGGFTVDADLATAALGFFLNGGGQLWVVRTVHYADILNAATKDSAQATLTLQDRAAVAVDTLQVQGKTDGTYANVLRIVISAPTSGAATEFNLVVEQDGITAEVFPNLSLVATAPNNVEPVINNPATGSNLIVVTDLGSATAAPDNLPALGIFGPLAGGDDGLANLDDNDFVGSPVSATGLRALDTVQGITLVIVPGRATPVVHNAMITYCEQTRDKGCFAVLDPPSNTDAVGIVSYVDSTALLLGLTEFAAIYWPRIRIVNPNRSVFGPADQIVVPPSGHLCGIYARVDSASLGGIYNPPAGITNGRLLGVVGFETDEVLDEAKRDLVFPKRINPLVVFPGTPRHIDGARTLRSDSNFPTIAERRGVIFIEQSLKQGLLFAKHQSNTEALRAAVARTINTFLLTQMRNGAFRSQDPAQAFFVDVSDALNPSSVVFAGQLIARIGLATNKPAEFIILKITQDTRALDEALAGG